MFLAVERGEEMISSASSPVFRVPCLGLIFDNNNTIHHLLGRVSRPSELGTTEQNSYC